MPFEPRGKNPRKTGLHRTALFIKTSWLILAGCGLKIGEQPYLPADRLYKEMDTFLNRFRANDYFFRRVGYAF